MYEDDVYQGLLNEGMPHSRIANLITKAIRYGTWDSELFGVRLIVTNPGTPVEYKIAETQLTVTNPGTPVEFKIDRISQED